MDNVIVERCVGNRWGAKASKGGHHNCRHLRRCLSPSRSMRPTMGWNEDKKTTARLGRGLVHQSNISYQRAIEPAQSHRSSLLASIGLKVCQSFLSSISNPKDHWLRL